MVHKPTNIPKTSTQLPSRCSSQNTDSGQTGHVDRASSQIVADETSVAWCFTADTILECWGVGRGSQHRPKTSYIQVMCWISSQWIKRDQCWISWRKHEDATCVILTPSEKDWGINQQAVGHPYSKHETAGNLLSTVPRIEIQLKYGERRRKGKTKLALVNITNK